MKEKRERRVKEFARDTFVLLVLSIIVAMVFYTIYYLGSWFYMSNIGYGIFILLFSVLFLIVVSAALLSLMGVLMVSYIDEYSVKRKKYRAIADEWFGNNNRVLKVDGMVYVIASYETDKPFEVESYVCNSQENCYGVVLSRWRLGKMVVKKKPFLPKNYTKELPKSYFVDRIGEYGEKIDTSLFPTWLIAELVEKKLTED